ncbi:MAG: hypothetical protein ACKVZJ_08750 [Phycisphaerales bacterium]
MRLSPWTSLSLAIVGDDLHSAVVSRGPWRARAWRGPVLRGFLSAPSDEVRRALSGLLVAAGASNNARMILTVPTAWCAVRPVPVDARGWAGAREGVLASIEQLAPVSAADAMVGVVSRRALDENEGGDDGGTAGGGVGGGVGGGAGGDAALSASGWLVVARRSQAGAWMQAIARAMGRDVSAVLSASMALPGLGLQNADRAEVLDELAGGVTVRHVLRGGELDELAAPMGFTDGASAGALRLPGASDDAGGTSVSGYELAVAAAIAEDLGAGQFVPIEGAGRRPARRWMLPAAACVGAALLGVAGLRVSEARYERAIADLAAQREAVADQQREVERVRARTLRLASLVEQGVSPIIKGWTPVLPQIASAQSAVTGDGFIYWVKLSGPDGASPGVVEMRGEAKQSGDVLAALESPGSLFANAKLVDPMSSVPQRGLETFTVRADRKAPSVVEGGAR